VGMMPPRYSNFASAYLYQRFKSVSRVYICQKLGFSSKERVFIMF